VAWFIIVFRVIRDIFRRHDIGGGAKVLWLIFVILLPFLGVFIYLIAQSKGMGERSMQRAQASQQQLDDYVRETASSAAPPRRSTRAKQLLDNGAITQAEFDAIRRKRLLDEDPRSARLRPRQKTLISPRWCLHERLPGGV
jgi:phospholipase D-like protein